MRHLAFLWFIQGAGSRSSFSYGFSLTMFSVTNSYQYTVVTYTVRGCTAHAAIWCIWQVLLWNPVVSFPVWDQLVDSVTVRSAGSGLRRPLWKSHLYHWHCALRWKPTLEPCASEDVSFCSVLVRLLSFLLCEFSHLPAAFSNKLTAGSETCWAANSWNSPDHLQVGCARFSSHWCVWCRKRRKAIIVWNYISCIH